MRCLTKSVKLVMKGWTVRGGESEREREGERDISIHLSSFETRSTSPEGCRRRFLHVRIHKTFIRVVSRGVTASETTFIPCTLG